MEVTLALKDGVKFIDAVQSIINIIDEDKRIEADPHTNEHYDLKDGRMWMKGDGTGKYWELFCNQREGHRDAREIFM